MTAREYCLTHDSVAYASMLGGIEIKGIEYGITDSVYCVCGAWCSEKSYHHVRINYTAHGIPFFIVHGQRVYMGECIRM